MGYDLHITRREFWADKDSAGFTLEEWVNYVESDKELRLNSVNEIKDGVEKQFENIPGYCEWLHIPRTRTRMQDLCLRFSKATFIRKTLTF